MYFCELSTILLSYQHVRQLRRKSVYFCMRKLSVCHEKRISPEENNTFTISPLTTNFKKING